MADTDGLIEPALLADLTTEQRREALAAAAAAKRAEQRAEQRALERAMAQRKAGRQQLQPAKPKLVKNHAVQFVSKAKRQQRKQEQKSEPERKEKQQKPNNRIVKELERSHGLSDSQLDSIKQSYMGSAKKRETTTSNEKEKRRKKPKMMFKFEWDVSEDTGQQDELYSVLPQNKNRRVNHTQQDRDGIATFESATTKPIDKMTARDWRIFRENYDIVVKGGKAPPPMRSFEESPSPELPKLHPSILHAIRNVLRYKEPSPIQRQAIPIGLQRRDLIGIAETGSGKTAAFGIPLCHYLLDLNSSILNRVADQGPLALIMAPTRELAIQINEEITKLLGSQDTLQSFVVVGGQPIQQQAMRLRQGVHIVVGTPGRINDCIEMAYLVLNQCCYIVMDEADRMIDLGFAPQMEGILNAMGGLLKSEDESLLYQQELSDLEKVHELPRHRLTAMFSATMPPEVERLAKEYLRHPAVVTIGDEDSGKNARILQRVIFLSSPSQKEKALREQLVGGKHNDKVIVFVNEKKHADGIGRMVERFGFKSVVLHGGKSQELREENLKSFRRGGVVLVATDVAGRGLDVPNVTHVINYDLPTRSIENYSHRIGRTGRAGKEGLATSFITEEDTGIMAPLKAYLESTGNIVPDRLARHPSSAHAVGTKHIT